MLRNAAVALAAVICLATISPTRADPGPVVNWLMQEPASLFDLGMMRLHIEKFEWSNPRRTFNEEMKAQYGDIPVYLVFYNWRENRIYVLGAIKSQDLLLSKEEAKQVCKRIIGEISRLANVDPKTGTTNGDHSIFADFFSHYDYENPKEPDNYKSKLDQIFVLAANVRVHNETTFCRRPLLSAKVYFEE